MDSSIIEPNSRPRKESLKEKSDLIAELSKEHEDELKNKKGLSLFLLRRRIRLQAERMLMERLYSNYDGKE